MITTSSYLLKDTQYHIIYDLGNLLQVVIFMFELNVYSQNFQQIRESWKHYDSEYCFILIKILLQIIKEVMKARERVTNYSIFWSINYIKISTLLG